MKMYRNPTSGRNCSGYRFKFHVKSIYPHPFYLPLEMKSLTPIRQLMQGKSPVSVFNTLSISEARKHFGRLRRRYDFDYWALKEYFIPDVHNPDLIIPLRLNDAQFHVIDIFSKRFFEKKIGRYVVSKTMRRCGLTTCIQAYILWMQTCRCRNNSFLCGPGEIALLPIKKNLCRYLHRDIVPQEPWIFIPKVDGRAFFNTFRSPDFIRGINLGYVHFANMSQWRDPSDNSTSRAFVAPVGAVLLEYFTLVVLEGDIPRKDSFNIKKYLKMNPNEKESVRKRNLSHRFSNPFFINEVMVSMTSANPHFFHIHLSSRFSPK